VEPGPERPPPGFRVGDLLDEPLDERGLGVQQGEPVFLLDLEVRHLGGEFARPRPGNGALASIDAQYVLYAVGMTPVPELTDPVMAQVEAVKKAMAPWAARQMYLNFAETQHPAAPFWTERAYRRLRQIKANVDPRDMIRANHPIPPAR